ncbi:SIMPL domain-containing protein [Pedobacter sp. GR22-6]|uniref:SIMPL domain-containing protein n=1 Tax=Pedobacter sp. GR22-6 TaxID=3127957 RepID=UPI00307F06D6
MKRLSILLLLSAITLASCSEQFDSRRKIFVTGYAEEEVTPDIIYFGIALKEYTGSNGRKVAIKDLEEQLFEAVNIAGIPKKDLRINDVSSYSNPSPKQKNPDFIIRKQYRIRMNELDNINTILSALDPKSIEYTQVESYDYSRLAERKKEIKIKALKDAKAKAGYLAEAGESTLGKLLEVRESSAENSPQAMLMMDEVALQQSSAQGTNIGFKKIKLSYVVSAVYELK